MIEMNKILFFLAMIIVFSCKDITNEQIDFDKSTANFDDLVLSDSLRALVVEKRQDSSFWDKGLFKKDLTSTKGKSSRPFKFGAFPVPRYDLIGKGTFAGLGSFGYTGSGKYFKTIKDKTILYNSFFVKKNKLNESRLGNKSDEIFFQIIILTDTIDSANFSHLGSETISRNHPDYLGQGFYKTKNNKIDYVAFTTPENESYAIVNTRLFNLNRGKIILIAPQKDGSLRSMQIESSILSSEEINQFTDNLLKEEGIVKFFTQADNI